MESHYSTAKKREETQTCLSIHLHTCAHERLSTSQSNKVNSPKIQTKTQARPSFKTHTESSMKTTTNNSQDRPWHTAEEYLERGSGIRRHTAVILPWDDSTGQRRPRHGAHTCTNQPATITTTLLLHFISLAKAHTHLSYGRVQATVLPLFLSETCDIRPAHRQVGSG